MCCLFFGDIYPFGISPSSKLFCECNFSDFKAFVILSVILLTIDLFPDAYFLTLDIS